MRGTLRIVGLGPGDPAHRTAAACAAIRDADAVVGYGPYVDQCADLLTAGHRLVRGTMGEEARRAEEALALAAGGARVALVSSGDAGVYGMAARTLAAAERLPEAERPTVEVVPGLTAVVAAAALLGAPLADDWAVVSLSDIHSDASTIQRRVRGAATGGFATALYNPRSRTRTRQLTVALEIFRAHRDGATPVCVVENATRPGERLERTTLSQLDPASPNMHALVLIAGDSGRWAGPWLVAERGRGA